MPFEFPRSKAGFEAIVDYGNAIETELCWNPDCKNPTQYKQTVSTECCTSCGLECDYWGAGANNVYIMAEKTRQQRQEEQRVNTYRMLREKEADFRNQRMDFEQRHDIYTDD
jgi:hypothetical protein